MAALSSPFNTWQQIAVGLSQLRGTQYDAVIDFQGAVRSALLARWSGAPIVYGDAQPRENAASMFYTRKILSNTNGTHVIQQALALAKAVIPDGTVVSALNPAPSRGREWWNLGRVSRGPGRREQNC